MDASFVATDRHPSTMRQYSEFGSAGVRDRLDPVFKDLGFERSGCHWARGPLFVEVPGTDLVDRADLVRVGAFVLRVIGREVLLAERLVGFKRGQTADGQQAVGMIAAFQGKLRMDEMARYLKLENVADAFDALTEIANGAEPVTDERLLSVLEHLTSGTRITHSDG